MRVLGIPGSTRRGSYNRRLLRTAGDSLPSAAQLEVWDRLADLPIYNEDLEQSVPDAVRELRETVATADAVLIATPEYNGSIPGGLKNALDWLSRPFPENALRDKPAAVMGATTGLFGAVWAQADTRKVLKTIGARVLETELGVGMVESAFSEDGRLADPDLQNRLEDLVSELADAAAGQLHAA